ncbi:MAG: aminoacetone oxidase family FAD-binding enzyme [Bacteroidales bacterium]|nr:aminoacetone oxidase family FAD-binding enzyme [Bacteroidales bacterium]
MKSDIIVIGAGASGLMAAYGAAKTLVDSGSDASVTLLEKMPRPARKIMITGKGRCNFTNLKDWNEFSAHIQSKANFVKPSFYNLTPQGVIDLLAAYGMPSVVERGDRAYPESHHASDVVDTLVRLCNSKGVKIETETEISRLECADGGFKLTASDGRSYSCKKLIIATGGLSYPTTGSTGDGLRWAADSGHHIVPTFPSLTALVPLGYKQTDSRELHIHRETPLTDLGSKLCGMQLKNIGVQLLVEGTVAQEEFGDVDFTDGGLEGPVGFQISRKAVKSLINGSRVSVVLDLKSGVELTELTARIKELWKEIDHDPRSARLHEKEKCRILLGKLMPWELIPAFVACNPGIMTLERRGRTDTKVWVNLVTIAKALKEWKFDIAGYVGYERCVITAGGVSTDDVVAKTLESRIVPGLYFCGEVLDMDCDTGGYNLQAAFCTGYLAGISAAKAL